MEKIRIAFFADILKENYDGAVRTMFHIINRIDPRRFELLLLCGEGPDKEIGHQLITIPNVEIPFNKSYRLALPFLVKGKLIKTLNEFNPHLIHISTPSALGHFALSYGKEKQIPVSTIYHTHFESYVKYYLRKFKEFIPLIKLVVTKSTRSFYNDCDRIFIPTSEMKTELEASGISSRNMVLWPRGVDKELFNPLSRSKQYITRITGNDNLNILFASRLVWEKNLETLIRIYTTARLSNLPYNFIIAGDGIAREELENAMPHAYFTGTLDQAELAKLYASADLFVFPSISETYGNVVIEAMSCGLPCVIANGGGSKSFIHHGYNGFLCEANNQHDYLDKIYQLLSNTELQAKFRMNGLTFVKKLDWNKLVQNLLIEWESMVYEKRNHGVAS